MAATLLSFSVGNFKSIQDVQTVRFHAGPSSDKDLSPNPVTVLLGANASGKSNLLEAMDFALTAVRQSATVWLEDDFFYKNSVSPFLLDDYSDKKPSFFEFDFIIKGIRYLYGFEYSYNGVEEEWMHYVPSKKWTPVFTRSTNSTESSTTWEWNTSAVPKSLQKEFERGGRRELVLSLAARANADKIGAMVKELTRSISFLPLGDSHKDQRLSQIAQSMRHEKLQLSEVTRMMQAADTGIENVSIDEDNLPAELAELAKRLTQTLSEREKEKKTHRRMGGIRFSPEQGSYIEMSDENLKAIAYQLLFTHRGEKGARPLKTQDQSDGTLTWLSVAPNIVDALRDGNIVVADELDSSLHSQLLGLVVEAFTDETTNIHEAQLIFSSHDTNLLENRKALRLPESAFWFVSKNSAGASEVYPLTDFSLHADANYERRYLSGRYGAVPHVSPALLRDLVLETVNVENSPEGRSDG